MFTKNSTLEHRTLDMYYYKNHINKDYIVLLIVRKYSI